MSRSDEYVRNELMVQSGIKPQTGSLKVGFLGAGMVSELHIQALRKMPRFGELVLFYDADPEVQARRTAQWNVPAAESRDALLASDIDAVFVLTPAEQHDEDVLVALHAGKHILVEKPVSHSKAALQEMKAVAKERGLVCMPAHNYIYTPEVEKLKGYLQEGLLGDVPASWIMYNIHHEEAIASRYPGIIRQIGTHLLYTHRYLFGAPLDLQAAATRYRYPQLQRDDQVSMTLTNDDGGLSHLFCSFAVSDDTSTPWTFLIKLLGTEGCVQLSWQDVVFRRALGTMSTSYGRYEETYEHEIRYFLDRCIGQGHQPLSTLDDTIAILEWAEHAEANIEAYRARLAEAKAKAKSQRKRKKSY